MIPQCSKSRKVQWKQVGLCKHKEMGIVFSSTFFSNKKMWLNWRQEVSCPWGYGDRSGLPTWCVSLNCCVLFHIGLSLSILVSGCQQCSNLRSDSFPLIAPSLLALMNQNMDLSRCNIVPAQAARLRRILKPTQVIWLPPQHPHPGKGYLSPHWLQMHHTGDKLPQIRRLDRSISCCSTEQNES